jgi:hypothetical protein
VTDDYAAVDYAQVLKELSDLHFPDADKIVLVQDNLSTHTTASLHAAFPAPEARRLANQFESKQAPRQGRLAIHNRNARVKLKRLYPQFE